MDETDADVVLTGDEEIEFPPGFATQLSDLVVARRVRVESTAGHRFKGTLVSVQLDDRHVLLRDIQDLPGGARASSAFVAHVDWIVPVDEETEP